MKIAVLALQGAFAEHQQMLQKLGADSMLIRNLADWQTYMTDPNTAGRRGLIIPGGESTAMTRIINDEELFLPVKRAIESGLPVFGTCAGLIMLDGNHLGTMDITVLRNAYGRQLGSFHTVAPVQLGDAEPRPLPMTFIRAPYIESVGEGVQVLSVVDGHIVAAQQGKQLVTAFHPELDDDTSIHEHFLAMV